MRKFPFYVFVCLTVLTLLKTGCSDIENVTAPDISSMIRSVVPAQAPYGARVMIGGTGFGANQDNLEIFFNESEAIVEELNDSTILTRVPKDATTGPVEVVVNGETLTGPSFTIDTSKSLWLEIANINPVEGRYGDSVEISGAGFNADPEQNKVYFGGTPAKVNSAFDTLLTATVPLEAQTGPVMVVVDKDTAIGPVFTVQPSLGIQIAVHTEGTQLDSDGYLLSVTGKDDRTIEPNDEVVYDDIPDNNVQVSLSGVEANCRVEGENPRNVTLSAESMTTTSFNIDCTTDLKGKIAFVSDRDGNDELYVQSADGSGVKRLTETPDIGEREPAISPDGLQVAFGANTESGVHIFIMDSDGSNMRQITKTGYWSSPSWSPEGNKLVFEGGIEIKDLYTVNTNGENIQNISNTEHSSEQNPDWSPNGNRIAYESFEDGDWEIYTIQEDGSGKAKITDNSEQDRESEWSPNGDKLVLLRTDPETYMNVIYIVNSDGSGENNFPTTLGSLNSPTWSPDGASIGYTKFSDGVYQLQIYSIKYNDLIYGSSTSDNDRSPHWNYK